MGNYKKPLMIAGVVVLILTMAAFALSWMLGQKFAGPSGNAFVKVIKLNAAPPEVQAAAAALRTSKVGYPMVVGAKTYLVISSGNDSTHMRLHQTATQGAQANPTMVDVLLKTDQLGSSLLIATTPLAKMTEYQFNLDGTIAGIPTLHNPHKLPLVRLDAAKRFAVVAPESGVQVGNGSLHVAGYAQVFEAQFRVTIMTAKGRVLGSGSVMAAAGAPSWGSFMEDISFDTTGLPETGLVLFEEGQGGAKLLIPVRFRPPSQLGYAGGREVHG